ncbi:uncharacterized protein Pstk [Hetaerina americana]|uniref:uncharacterized protein Pstk n=1 Tax=Hetaerina americana TaxID=62018 RepID=UPI003A7F2F3A
MSNSSKVAVLVLIGLPGSGKTTLCVSLPYFLGPKYHIIHICYDQIIPFKEDRNWEEKNGLWKDERAKVVQAAERLICKVIGANRPGNERCTCDEVFQQKPKLTAKTSCGCYHKDPVFQNTSGEVVVVNENIEDDINRKHEEIDHLTQSMGSCFNLECAVINNKGHYTILNSINDIVSVCEKISECVPEDELFIICVDDNCYYRSMRKEWWNLATKYELPFCCVTLKCDVEVCVRRVRERLKASTFHGPNVPENVINRMDEHLEFPDGDSYPWEKYSIVIDSNSLNVLVVKYSNLLSEGLILDRFSLESLNRIKQLINASLLEPAKPLSKDRHHCNTPVAISVSHMADLALRKIVRESDPAIRPLVNLKRKNILEDIRNGKLSIPSDAIEELKDGFGNKFDEYMATLVDI